jgi:hypothetical protein
VLNTFLADHRVAIARRDSAAASAHLYGWITKIALAGVAAFAAAAALFAAV